MLVKLIITLQIIVLTGLQVSYAQKASGYYLYAQQNGTTAVLLDTNGNTFHSWSFSSTDRTGYSTYMLPGGTLLRTVTRTGNSFSGGPICGKVQKVNWEGTVTWDYVYSTNEYCTHHDIHPMPNGNVLLIAYERRTAAEATQAGSTKAIEMWPDKIVEVKQTGATTGEVVWEWKAWDHLVQNVDPNKSNYQSSIADHPELLNINYKTNKDWMHMNGLDYNPILDQITFSSHNLNEIYVIDHSTTTAEAAGHKGGNSGKGGDILYRWGNPAAYNASGTAVINVTHDAHWIPLGRPKAGQLVCFNNGGTTSASTIDYVDAPVLGFNYVKASGAPFQPTSYSARTVCNGKTTNMGNSVQLENGNTLICIALAAKFYEIDKNGTTLFTKTISSGGGGGGPTGLPQTQHYTECEVSNTLSLTAKASKRITCGGESIQLFANPTGGSNYTYQWSSSSGFMSTEQNPTVSPTTSTTYYVTVSSGGCSSTTGLYIHVTSKPNTSAITGTTNVKVNSTQLYSVTKNEGSTYQWQVQGGTINGANNGNQIQVTWSNSVGNALVSVIETNANNCSGDKKELSVTISDNSGFEVTPQTIDFVYTTATKQAAITCNNAWSIEEDLEWVSVDKNSGNGNATLNITATTNNNLTLRTGVIRVLSGQTAIEITVTQSAAEVLTSSADSIWLENNGEQKTIQVTSNINWSVSSDKQWMNISPKNGSSSGNITISASQNTEKSIRTGTITITGGAITKKIIVLQKAASGNTTSKRHVKFAVDMRNVTVNTTGVHVTGSFQEEAGLEGGDWQSNTAPLKKEGSTTIYSTVLTLPVNSMYEYKFLNGDQFYDSEIVPEASQVGFEFNDNRWFFADSTLGDTIFVGPLLYASNAAVNKKMIRFKVDMQNSKPIAQSGIHVMGSFQKEEWNPSGTLMHSFDGNIYEAIVYVDSGTSHQYKFINGSQTQSAENVPTECSTEGSRVITVNDHTVTNTVCFSACTACNISGIVSEHLNNGFTVTPNPAIDAITIQSSFDNYTVIVNDIIGRTLLSIDEVIGRTSILSLDTLSSGTYFIIVTNKTGISHSQKITKL